MLTFRPRVVKEVAGVPKEAREALLERLNAIARDLRTQCLGFKRLIGRERDYRICQGDWRAVCNITDKGDVDVILVRHRKEVAVTILRTGCDVLLQDLEEAEDRLAVLKEEMAIAQGDRAPSLTADEAKRLLAGESPVKVWREKLDLTQRQLAACAGTSQGLVDEIEAGRKRGSISTLRSIAGALGVSVDALLPSAYARAADQRRLSSSLRKKTFRAIGEA